MATTNTTTTVTATTRSVRADQLRLGDVLLVGSAWRGGAAKLVVVTNLELVGDDVEVNGTLTTSRSNTMDVVS